jgi:hypothetical protein
MKTFSLPAILWDAAFQDDGAVAIGRDTVGTSACLQAQFTINAASLSNDHCIVWAIREFVYRHLPTGY